MVTPVFLICTSPMVSDAEHLSLCTIFLSYNKFTLNLKSTDDIAMPSSQRNPLTSLFWLTGNPKATCSQQFVNYFIPAFSYLALSSYSPFLSFFFISIDPRSQSSEVASHLGKCGPFSNQRDREVGALTSCVTVPKLCHLS